MPVLLSDITRSSFVLLVFVPGLLVAQSSGAERPPWAAPPLEQAVAVRDGRTGELVTFSAMLDRLAQAEVVFLGETHLDETTHRVELAVYEGMLERRQGAVVLAMEMFQRDVQSVLDAYLAGDIDEGEFLAGSRPWGNYRAAYRPLVERAREAGSPVVASNFPRPLLRQVAREGLAAFDALEGDERRHAPAEILPNTKAYWRRVDNAIRGHLGMMPPRAGDDERLTATQTLWDNSMGESCALALEEHPGSLVLHVNGGFHSAYWDGTVHQLKLRRPQVEVLTVDIRPTRNPAVAGVAGRPVADFVIHAESRASDRNRGEWSVAFDRSLTYRLHMPEGLENPAPLLVWLGDDGLVAEDGLELWRRRLGDEVALAVIEPPYRALQHDLSEGGRWFWADSFAGDVGSLVGAVERVWGYLCRNHDIDPTRVCVAGEGTGATVAAAIALLGNRMAHEAVALYPRRFAQLKDYPLPLPELKGDTPPPAVRLQVVGRSAEDEAWWGEELAAYDDIGLAARWTSAPTDPWRQEEFAEDQLRNALGLEPKARPTADASPGRLVVAVDSPRARHWARLRALEHTAATGRPLAVMARAAEDPSAVELRPVLQPTALGDKLPRCPGPFGGTTVLVLDEATPSAALEPWEELARNDPLAARSRFHRVRLANGVAALPVLLEELEAAGRRNVLIVPATFCAGSERMRELERSVRPVADRLTLHWLPGLGGAKLELVEVR